MEKGKGSPDRGTVAVERGPRLEEAPEPVDNSHHKEHRNANLRRGTWDGQRLSNHTSGPTAGEARDVGEAAPYVVGDCESGLRSAEPQLLHQRAVPRVRPQGVEPGGDSQEREAGLP